ncbi:beta-1,3-galactosyltransferase 2 [Danio rerio]|uniref:Hexosyltransferase n=1 Tax=Danio rerio TaxID=7955 RepID=A0A8M1RP90_DANRE|nr:beta-1,3-galactosyltransferase 2-like [Danio rerio]XP_021325280.1 beta-1,3-galactosyltransferase 2-like [Danio rerio]|eukprot:XP_003201135.2 beta-1,3-galactosyltransferase 2-like [Danio rerio]
MAIGILSARCCLTPDPASMHHIKRGFILLVVLTLSLLVVAYIYHSPYNHFNVVNLIKSCKTESLAVSKDFWNKMHSTTSISTNPVPQHQYVAHPSNYHFIIDEHEKCKQINPFVVFMVPVALYQREARNAIRSTWGNETTVQGKTVLTLFVVGLTVGADSEKAQQQLEEESRQHRDLIQSNFVDSYFNLTIKTMVTMDWLATRCPQATFSMKVDSDMYINLENLMTLLLRPELPRQNYITGFLMWDRPVIRNKKSRYYVSEELYPDTKYPTYVLGVAYVFSNDLPKKLVEASKDVAPFNIEDAYIGACLKQIGVKPSRSPDPSQFRTYMKDPKHHDLSKVITTIARSPKQIVEFWKSVKRQT